MTIKFFAHLRGDNITRRPDPLQAQTLDEAKKEAWGTFGDGYKDHWIEICEAAEYTPGEVEAGATLLSRHLNDRSWQAA